MSKRFYLLVALAMVLVAVDMCGCGPDVRAPEITGDGNVVDTDIEQHSNNPWPYAVITAIMVLAFFVYLYASKRFTGFGRT